MWCAHCVPWWKLLSLGLGIAPPSLRLDPCLRTVPLSTLEFSSRTRLLEPSPLSLVKGSLLITTPETGSAAVFWALTLSVYPILTPSLFLLTPFNPPALLRAGKPSPWERKTGPFLRRTPLSPQGRKGLRFDPLVQERNNVEPCHLGAAQGAETHILPILSYAKIIFHLPGNSLSVLIDQHLLVPAYGHWRPRAFMQSCSLLCEQSIWLRNGFFFPFHIWWQ